MQFPFIEPVKPWVKAKLEQRESNIETTSFLSPFIILTSFSVVAKLNGAGVEPNPSDIISKAGSATVKYNGCRISNSTDITKMYQTGTTIVGYDLDNKEIVVENEKNRKVSLPIIQKMDIDTDNGNNTLKTAKLEIKVFTLKQLEMFELFFLRPGTNLLLEYGNNTDLIKKKHGIDEMDSTTIQKYLFYNQYSSYDKAAEKFADFYNTENNKFLEYRDAYLNILETTQGNYDYWTAKVTNFTYAIDADGTYNVTLDISAGNELQLWMPVKQSEKKGNAKSGTLNQNTPPINTWLYKIAADLNLDTINHKYSKDAKELEEHFFNWQFINKKQSDTKYSNKPYISMEFILMLLNDMQIYKTSSQKIQAIYKLERQNKKVIPMNSNECIMSTTIDMILPGTIPVIKVVPDKSGTSIVIDEEEKKKKDKTGKEITTKQIKYNYFQINDKSFNLTSVERDILVNDISDTYPGYIKGTVGNLLNIFISYDAVVGAYQTSYTQSDFINSILNIINTNMFGLCNLQVAADSDSTHSTLTIIDYKLRTDKEDNNVPSYRFKLSPPMTWEDADNKKYTKKSSIIKSFEFNYEMGVLMQAQAMYQTQLSLNAAKKDSKQTNNPTKAIVSRENFDYVYAVNADGYYSINHVEFLINKKAEPFNIETESKGFAKVSKTEADKEIKNQNDVLRDRSIKFKWTSGDKKKTSNEATLIYLDSALIQNKIDVAPPKTTSLTFLEIKFTIDGIAGLHCGQYFQIDGVPEIYNKNGFFQITNVKHNIDSDNGWVTTIEAGLRIKNT